jgi:Ice-binding-like
MKKSVLIASLVIAALALVALVVLVILPALMPSVNPGITNPGTTMNPSANTNPGATNSGTTTNSGTSGGTTSGGASGTTSGGTSSGGSTAPSSPPASSGSAGPAAVNLGTAGNYVILAKTGISTTGTTSITGNLGISPAAASFITGFGLIADSSNTFSTSSLVTGKIYASDYVPPTPSIMTTAVSDMQTAYVDAAGRTNPDATELGAGNIDGMTLTPGLYKWGTGLNIPTGVTLDCQGNANAVFIFQVGQTLTVGNGAIVTLANGCQAKNIFWQVAGQTTLGTTANFEGIILDQTAIVLNNGATLQGRALAQSAVTLIANSVTSP